eukprot:COSAG02_NODE_29075_length_576_cov_1.327044_1_plen_52_part_10
MQPLPDVGIEAVIPCNVGVRAWRWTPAAGVDLVAAKTEAHMRTNAKPCERVA